MSSYFARLAGRTGIGGEPAPATQRDGTLPLESEDVVTFVAQPKPPGAVVPPSSEPATAPGLQLPEPTGEP